MKKTVNNKNKEFDYKKFVKTPKGKAVVFFGAYLIFFIFLGIFSRTSTYRTPSVNKNDNKLFDLKSIEKSNYKFNYKIQIDNNSISYLGVKNKYKEKFSCDSLKEFYGEDENYYTENSGIWIKVDSPYIYNKFLDVDNINLLLESATYDSVTNYESGKKVYNYLISSATIAKIIDEVEIDPIDDSDTINFSVDENKNVESITMYLNNYCKTMNICSYSMSINLKYDLFGKIEEITSPLE